MYVCMYINNIFIVYDKGQDWVVYLKYVENVIPLSKLIGLLFLFCLPLLSILFLKTKRDDLARPVMGTIFLVNSYWASEASPTLGCSIEISRDCCRYVSYVKLTA